MIDHRKAESLMAAAIDFPLSPDEQTTVDSHLAGCDRCRTVGAQLRRHALVLGEMATEGAPLRIRSAVEAAAYQAIAPNQRFMLLLAAALLAAAAVGGAIVVGSGILDLDLSINPALPSPSAAPSEAPLPPALPTSGFAQVKVSELSVRTEPQAGASQVGTLQEGDVVSILEGQTAADGLVWYRVRLGELTGWATARDSSTEWIGELPEPTSAWVLRVQRQYPTGALNDVTVVLYSDGRLVTPGPSGWEQRRLTDQGTRLFVQEAVSSGLLEVNAEYVTEPPGYEGGYVSWSISVVAERGPVMVSALSSSDAPEAALIVSLAERLTALAVDPPTTWLVDADRAREVPEALTYNLVVTPYGALSDFAPEQLLGDADIDTVVLPLPTSVLEIGDPALDGPSGARCASLTPDEAAALREAFYELGLARAENDLSYATVRLRWAAQDSTVSLDLYAVDPGVDPCVNPYRGTG
jgi:hypothetical protein